MYKTIIILGAETTIGKYLTNYLLSQNYFVTIYIHNKGENLIQHFNLEVIEGDIFDYEALSFAIAGQHVVINVIDYKRYKSGSISAISQNIIHAINKNYVDKYVGLTPFGSGQTKDKLTLIYKLFNFLNVSQPTLNEYSFQQSLLEKSKLNYTLIQASKITSTESEVNNLKIIKVEDLKNINNVNQCFVSEKKLCLAFESIMNEPSYAKSTIILASI